jgi:hypothetical protein
MASGSSNINSVLLHTTPSHINARSCALANAIHKQAVCPDVIHFLPPHQHHVKPVNSHFVTEPEFGRSRKSTSSSRSPTANRLGPKCHRSNMVACGRPAAGSIWTVWFGGQAPRWNSRSCARSVKPRTRPRNSRTIVTKETARGSQCFVQLEPALGPGPGKGRTKKACWEWKTKMCEGESAA